MDYFKVKRINNSSLSYINPDQEGSPSKYKAYIDGILPKESSKSLEFGDLLHRKVLEPQLYNIIQMDTPSDTIRSIIEYVVSSASKESLDECNGNLDAFGHLITEGASEIGYGGSWKDSTVIQKVITSGGDYFQGLLDTKNKDVQIVSPSMAQRVEECNLNLDSHLGAVKLLGEKYAKESYNELEISWEKTVDGKEYSLKSKIDRLIVNTKKKTFTIVDVKTTSKHVSKYPDSFLFWHTYRQLAFYIDAAKEFLKQCYPNDDYTPNISHYIVCVMSIPPHMVRVFKISSDHISRGRTEYNSLLERINYHTTTGDWVNEMEYQQGQIAWEIKID